MIQRSKYNVGDKVWYYYKGSLKEYQVVEVSIVKKNLVDNTLRINDNRRYIIYNEGLQEYVSFLLEGELYASKLEFLEYVQKAIR
jgi:hypothetical protein